MEVRDTGTNATCRYMMNSISTSGVKGISCSQAVDQEMEEVWIRSRYPGLFVSSHGRIRNADGQLRRLVRHNNGYLKFKPGPKYSAAYVHTVVLESFVCPRPSPLHEADHIDMDRANNSLSNLRWLTRAENRARRRLPRGEENKSSKLKREDAAFIKSSTLSSVVLAEMFGVKPRQIRKIRGGAQWQWI